MFTEGASWCPLFRSMFYAGHMFVYIILVLGLIVAPGGATVELNASAGNLTGNWTDLEPVGGPHQSNSSSGGYYGSGWGDDNDFPPFPQVTDGRAVQFWSSRARFLDWIPCSPPSPRLPAFTGPNAPGDAKVKLVAQLGQLHFQPAHRDHLGVAGLIRQILSAALA
jgi:hypothetical protein